jgi:hypothetical protein
VIPFASFAPDLADINPAASDVIKNVMPKSDSYGPMPSFQVYSAALPARPLGAIVARANDGNLSTFAGTATGLYKFNTATLAWGSVSGASAPYHVGADAVWDFRQFGDYVIATNASDPPQVYQLGVSSTFADLGGTPPHASYTGVIGDFFVLLGLSTNNMKMQWSGLNAPDYWTAGRRSSDVQTFPDGGPIQGFSGFERGGIVFQEDCIREMIPDLSSPFIFQFQKTEEARGVVAPRSIITAGRTAFFYSQDGFYQYGSPSAPIGNEKVDRWFSENADETSFALMQGVDDPINKIAFWRFKSTSANSSTVTDKMLAYHYAIGKWTLIEQELTWIMPAVTAGYTLEGLDALGYTLDTLPFSLDSRAWTAGNPVIAGFDSSYRLGFFAGDNMEATLETSDVELNPGRRGLVTGFRPVADTETTYGTVASKPTHGASLTWKSEFLQNSVGIVPARAEGRLHRFRMRIPEGTVWNHAHGVEPILAPTGER